MTYRVVLQPRAERDVREAAGFLRDTSQSSASDAYGREVRVLLFGRRPGVYRVLFAIEGGVVQVHTVRHAARRSLREESENEGE